MTEKNDIVLECDVRSPSTSAATSATTTTTTTDTAATSATTAYTATSATTETGMAARRLRASSSARRNIPESITATSATGGPRTWPLTAAWPLGSAATTCAGSLPCGCSGSCRAATQRRWWRRSPAQSGGAKARYRGPPVAEVAVMLSGIFRRAELLARNCRAAMPGLDEGGGEGPPLFGGGGNGHCRWWWWGWWPR